MNHGVILRCSLSGLKFISKAAEMVGKKQKKTEKDEKEFRKKFKVCLALYHESLSISVMSMLNRKMFIILHFPLIIIGNNHQTG